MGLAERILTQAPGGGPEWLQAVRARHAERVRAGGLPQRGVEAWKYTSVAALEKRELAVPAPEDADPGAIDLAAFVLPGLKPHRLVFVDGRFRAESSDLGALPRGVTVTPLARAQEAELDAVRARLAEDFGAPEAAFAALNTAVAGDGLIVRVAPGCELEHPLQCLYLGRSTRRDLALTLRNVVVLGAGARCTWIECHGALGEVSHFTNLVDQFELAAGARLDHLRLQTEADGAYLITRSDARVAADARYRYHGFDLGGRLVRHDLNASLDGRGADVSLAGVYALDGRRHVDNHTRIDHCAPDARSVEFFKGVVDGRARAVFNGKVVVHENAAGTDAIQTNRNLVLSPHAEVDTKPELEIYADDVKCAHGATVGQLDEAQLFYLRSRGLPAAEARVLLTYAFCREIVDRLEPESVRDHIAALVLAHLPRPEALEALG